MCRRRIPCLNSELFNILHEFEKRSLLNHTGLPTGLKISGPLVCLRIPPALFYRLRLTQSFLCGPEVIKTHSVMGRLHLRRYQARVECPQVLGISNEKSEGFVRKRIVRSGEKVKTTISMQRADSKV